MISLAQKHTHASREGVYFSSEHLRHLRGKDKTGGGRGKQRPCLTYIPLIIKDTGSL